MPRKLNPFSSSGRIRMASIRRSSVKSRPYRKAKGIKIKGKGGYWGRMIGEKIGGLFGKAAEGAKYGDSIGDLVAGEVSGLGPVGAGLVAVADYAAKRQQASGSGAYILNDTFGKSMTPTFKKNDDGTRVIITHDEYIGDIVSSGALFQLEKYDINPGQTKCFPWLSGIAGNFEQYRIRQLMFHYRSTTSDIGSSTNGQVGTIVMAPVYNNKVEDFVDKMSMLAQDNSISSKCTESMSCGIECDDKKLAGDQFKFVRKTIALDNDYEEYDHGKFYIAVSNAPAGFTGKAIGELWVSYSIELHKPVAGLLRGELVPRDYYVSTANRNAGAAGATPVMWNDAYTMINEANNLNTQLYTYDLSATKKVTRLILPANRSGVYTVTMTMASTATLNLTGFLAQNSLGPVPVSNYMFNVSDVAGPSAFSGMIIPGGYFYEGRFTFRHDAALANYVDIAWESTTSNIPLIPAPGEFCLNHTLEIRMENGLAFNNANKLKMINVQSQTKTIL